MTDKPQMYATDHYQWVRHKDGREQLQRAWIGDGKQEWRIAPVSADAPPKVFNAEGEWIED